MSSAFTGGRKFSTLNSSKGLGLKRKTKHSYKWFTNKALRTGARYQKLYLDESVNNVENDGTIT